MSRQKLDFGDHHALISICFQGVQCLQAPGADHLGAWAVRSGRDLARRSRAAVANADVAVVNETSLPDVTDPTAASPAAL